MEPATNGRKPRHEPKPLTLLEDHGNEKENEVAHEQQYKETPQFSKFLQRFKNGFIPATVQQEARSLYSQSVDNNQCRYVA